MFYQEFFWFVRMIGFEFLLIVGCCLLFKFKFFFVVSKLNFINGEGRRLSTTIDLESHFVGSNFEFTREE